jgi:hypothetical protein
VAAVSPHDPDYVQEVYVCMYVCMYVCIQELEIIVS